jgi:hypothetical protein
MKAVLLLKRVEHFFSEETHEHLCSLSSKKERHPIARGKFGADERMVLCWSGY